MHVTDDLVEFIANFEGFRSTPYWDVNHYSIGFGTPARSSSDGPITRAEGLHRLKEKIEHDYEPAVNRLDLWQNQNRFNALVSFIYNLGPGVLSDQTIGSALRRQDWRAVADAMLLYNRSGGVVLAGLTRRREAERAMFLRVAYTDDERRAIRRLREPGPNPRARAWLEAQAVKIKAAARKPDGSFDWRIRDRGRRYQGIRRALSRHR